MTGIDDLIMCPRCLKPMGEGVDTMVCKYCGYNEKEELLIKENNELKKENEELRQELIQLKNNNGIEISRRCEAIEAWNERFKRRNIK